MENIFESINPVDWFVTTNGVIESLSPTLMVLLGIILAFFIIDSIVSIFRKNKGYASGEYMASLPDLTKEDREYYLSKKYKGNKDYIPDEDDYDYYFD